MPRRRSRILAWSAAALTAACLVALLLSTRVAFWFHANAGPDLLLTGGGVQLQHLDPKEFPGVTQIITGLHVRVIPWQAKWDFALDRGNSSWLMFIPLWCPLLLSATATIFLFRRSRHLPNLCPHCHYNLRGLPPSNGQVSCPECGNSSNPGGTHVTVPFC